MNTFPLKLRILFIQFILLVLATGCKDNPVANDPGLNTPYQISYHKIVDQNWEIYVNSLKGDYPRNISVSKYEDSYNSWSPNGKYIAYAHFFKDPFTRTDIYLYNIETGQCQNLTPEDGFDAAVPRWTPDGKKIIFDYHKISENPCTYIMNVDGTGKRKLLNYQLFRLYFLADNYSFIYQLSTFDNTEDNIYISNLDGTYNDLVVNLKTISSDYATVFGFNPNRNELLLLISNDPKQPNYLASYNINTKKVVRLIAPSEDYYILGANFSKDCSLIAYLENRNGNQKQRMCVYDFNTGSTKTIIELDNQDGFFDHVPPVFSPNNKYIAYVKDVYQPGTWVSWKSYLYTVDLSTNNIQFLDEADDPFWNPKFRY